MNTLQQAQQRVDEWIHQYGGGYFSELTNLGILAEETGELARWIVRQFGDQSFKTEEKNTDVQKAIQDEWRMSCGY
jgi:NTP pyrophosphatase (non-canonical NTP hydrolase)